MSLLFQRSNFFIMLTIDVTNWMVRFSCFSPEWGTTIFHSIKKILKNSNITLKNEFVAEDPSSHQGFLTMAILASDREMTNVGSSLL